MDNFVQYAPTEVVFGRNTEEKTGEEVRKWGGSRVLIVYGGGSAVRSGLIGRVEHSLEQSDIRYSEYGGAKPNPTLDHAREGVRRALDEHVDFILAVGGGSAIDTAKAIAHGCANPGMDLWDIWMKKTPLIRSLPVGAVLTIAAAGSEMSDSAVLTNTEIGRKAGLSTEFNRCKFAIMNPELTFTVSEYQLACGVCDIMMHTMERYFIPGYKCEMTDEIAEGLLRTVIHNAGIAVKNRKNYDAMAEIMWCSSLSHNGLTECGRGKDFSVHKLGQALGARYDVTHGASLSAVWGSWAKYIYSGAVDRFARFARKVWEIEEADDQQAAVQGIRSTVAFFHSLGLPVSLPELDVDADDQALKDLAMDATRNDTIKLTRIRPLGAKEVLEIFRMANQKLPR